MNNLLKVFLGLLLVSAVFADTKKHTPKSSMDTQFTYDQEYADQLLQYIDSELPQAFLSAVGFEGQEGEEEAAAVATANLNNLRSDQELLQRLPYFVEYGASTIIDSFPVAPPQPIQQNEFGCEPNCGQEQEFRNWENPGFGNEFEQGDFEMMTVKKKVQPVQPATPTFLPTPVSTINETIGQYANYKKTFDAGYWAFEDVLNADTNTQVQNGIFAKANPSMKTQAKAFNTSLQTLTQVLTFDQEEYQTQWGKYEGEWKQQIITMAEGDLKYYQGQVDAYNANLEDWLGEMQADSKSLTKMMKDKTADAMKIQTLQGQLQSDYQQYTNTKSMLYGFNAEVTLMESYINCQEATCGSEEEASSEETTEEAAPEEEAPTKKTTKKGSKTLYSWQY